MKKLLFVMNPFAGMRKGSRYLSDILSIFNRAEYDVTAYMTAGPGDAALVVEKRAADFDLVVCAGGDGTFNETVTGLIRGGSNTPVGYIPCGTTNDFAASLRLPQDPVKAARNIVDGSAKAYDVGKFADRYFAYVASFGAFTRASYSTPQSIKNALGHIAYLLEGIQEIAQIKAEHVRIEMEARTIEGDFIFGAICNSTSVGGVLTLDPKQVDLCDGRFELLLVRVPRDILEVSECIQALQRQEYNCSMITFLSTDKMKIYTNPDMPWTLDGERCDGAQEITAENLHKAVALVTKEEL